MEAAQDQGAMLSPGDYEKLDKRQKEAFHALQERAVQFLMQECNHYHLQFPDVHVDFRFQAEVYQDVKANPGRFTYSNRVY